MELKVAGLFCMIVMSVFMSVRTEQNCNPDNCRATNGDTCNGHGTCDCGICTCDYPYSGVTCEECPTCQSQCEVFKGCVGCKIFLTGPLSIMECLTKCDYIANYIPEDKYKFDVEDNSDRKLCKHTNENLCVESFKIGNMSGGYRDLYIRTEVDCTSLPTLPPYIPEEVPVIDETILDETTTSPPPPTTTTTITETQSTVTTTTQTVRTRVPTTYTTKTLKLITPTSPPKPQTDRVTSASVHTTKLRLTTNKTPENHGNGEDDNQVIQIVVDDDGTDDSFPEDAGPVIGSDEPRTNNPGSGGIKSSDSSIVCVLVSVMCSVYFYGLL